MNMKKELLLTVAAIALYAAAREYGIHSLGDLKRKVSPYLKLLDFVNDEDEGESQRTPARASNSRSGQGQRSNSPQS